MLLPGVNTYVDLPEAMAYAEGTFQFRDWATVENEDQARLLLLAARRLGSLRFSGLPLSLDQVLPFPRYAPRPALPTYGLAPTVPQAVKAAQVEEALYLLSWQTQQADLSDKDRRLGALRAAGVTTVRRKLGDVETQYTLSASAGGLVPTLTSLPVGPGALRLLSPYLVRAVTISSQSEYPKHYLLPGTDLDWGD